MSQFKAVLAAFMLLLLLAPGVGHAESDKDYYVTIGIGPQWREYTSDSLGAVTFNTGFALNGAVGYRLPCNFRTEFEGSYFNNDFDTYQAAGSTKKKAGGTSGVTALFGNLYYDVPLGQSRFAPYVGFGVGSYKVSVQGLTNGDLQSTTAYQNLGPGFAVTADSSWTLAWQARIGTSIALNRKVDMLIGYRYFHGNDMDLMAPMGLVLHPNDRSHNLDLGLRYNF